MSRRTKKLDAARTGLLGALAAKAAKDAAADAAERAAVTQNAAVVRAFLDDIHFNYSERMDDEHAVFRGTVVGKGGIIDTFQWRILVDENCVQSFFTLPIHVPEKRQAAMSDFLMRVNWDLRWGKLTYDIGDDAEMVFQLTVPAFVLRGDPEVEVDRLIGLPLMVLRHYVPGVIEVLQGVEPAKAYVRADRASAREEEVEAAEDEGEVAAEAAAEADEELAAAAEMTAEDLAELLAEGTKEEDAGQEAVAVRTAGKGYSLEGLNVTGKVSLDRVVAAVRKFLKTKEKGEDSPRMNILLSGPSGAGKTAFVQYLGRELGVPVTTVSASDVLSPLVGKTEQNLARIFREARATGSILFFDEVDSLLASRANAQHSWECIQVNELLQQMEKFGGVLVGATNYEPNLDTAVARRFTFKLKLDYLTNEGKEIFFGRFFKTALSEEERARLHAIANLTPGDFRTVREELFYLSEKKATNADRLDALAAESAAKDKSGPPVGFAA